jgi:hypothetical protein
MSDIIRHPAWPNSRTSTGGWVRHPKRDGRIVDTPTVRAIEEFFGIYDLEDWMLRSYYLRHLTYAEIAEEVGVSQGTVGHWFSQMGVTIRQVATEVMEERLREQPARTGERQAEREA